MIRLPERRSDHRMSDESLPGSVEVGVSMTQRADTVPGPNEFEVDLRLARRVGGFAYPIPEARRQFSHKIFGVIAGHLKRNFWFEPK